MLLISAYFYVFFFKNDLFSKKDYTFALLTYVLNKVDNNGNKESDYRASHS